MFAHLKGGWAIAFVVTFAAGGAFAIAADKSADAPRTENPKLLAAAQKVLEINTDNYRKGVLGSEEVLYSWSRRVRDLEVSAGDDPKARAAANQSHLDRMKAVDKIVQARSKAGHASSAEVAASNFYVAEAESFISN